MNPIYIVLITMVLTIALSEGLKELYKALISRWSRTLSLERRITKLEGNKLPVDNSFKHFVDDKFKRLEGTLKVHHVSLKGLDDVQLMHAHSISKLEKK